MCLVRPWTDANSVVPCQDENVSFASFTAKKSNVANWPIYRPKNSKLAQQKCRRPWKFIGLESGLIPKMWTNFSFI
jgi:hypothetical protein